MFGNPETTTGGRALKFYSSVRLDVRRTETLKQGGEMVGNHTKVKVVKNKVAPPFKQAEFDIMFGTGISREGDILDLASMQLVNKSGAWYSYNGERIGQGRENAKIFLKDHPDICDEIEKQVRIHYHLLPDEEGQAKEIRQQVMHRMLLRSDHGEFIRKKRFLRNAEALKRQTVQKQQKNLTEEPEEYRRRKA